MAACAGLTRWSAATLAMLSVAPSTASGQATGAAFRDCADCPELVIVPDGRYQKGPRISVAGHEKRRRAIRIDQPFAVGKYEVTVDEFWAFLEQSGYGYKGHSACEPARDSALTPRDSGFAQTGRHPVVCVSWEDAAAYARWLAAKTGKPYRLLRDDEWEYVARAGADGEWPWPDGERSACRYENLGDLSSRAAGGALLSLPCDDGFVFTAPVGSFRPNVFGLHDMLGNVSEWIEDCSRVASKVFANDRRKEVCAERLFRGGSWADVRGAHFIGANAPDRAWTTRGFRVARDLF